MGRPKLLLADDSVTIRKVVEMTFADEGVDVIAVPDAQAAMQQFVEIQPDIVLVDTGLAGTSGYQICEMIKQDEATRNIPVLLLVGAFEPFDQDAAERAGADGFMTKPFHSIRDLVAKVSELLGTQPGAPIGVAPEPVNVAASLPETADIDSLYERSMAEPEPQVDLSVVDELLGDAEIDDELIETAAPDPSGRNNGLDAAPVAPSESIKVFDWSPGAIVTEAQSEREPEPVVEATAPQPEIAPLVEEPHPFEAPTARPEPSPELVAEVARLVIEKLSDKTVREIAQEAVPRIAEKLIREALDQKKNA